MSPNSIRNVQPERQRWFMRYPPVFLLAVGLVLLLAILPSALNLPQSNPTTTPEFAPVPPDDEGAPPPGGNLSSLGLASSSSSPSEELSNQVQRRGRAAGKSPSTKRCVGSPPRQSEDPMSPPCVAHFEGDNGGATYQGVTGDEIRVLLFIDGGSNGDPTSERVFVGSRGNNHRPQATYYDLSKPPSGNEPYDVAAARVYQRYFNLRYQTYKREVRFWVYYSRLGRNGYQTYSEVEARADAADNYDKVKPFATVIFDRESLDGVAYAETMASKGVLNFGTHSERPASLFRSFPGLLWGFPPSQDQHIEQFVDYVCRKVVPHPVSFGGNDGDTDSRLHNGRPRKFGLLSPRGGPKLQFAQKVRAGIERCGGAFVATGTHPGDGGIFYGGSERYGPTAMADFKSKGVTTIIWAEGYETEYSKAAKNLLYFPEWIIAGDGNNEDIVTAKYQDRDVWRHAWIVTSQLLEGPRRTEPCVQALKEGDPGYSDLDTSLPCLFYSDIRQLFTGIQVAGPRLTVKSIDQGFHAIPPIASNDPKVPSCYYEPGDYTCIKDSIPMWYDPDMRSPFSSSPGCWRVPQQGLRYIPGRWSSDNVDDQRSGSDPCNAYTSGRFADPSPGPESPSPQ